MEGFELIENLADHPNESFKNLWREFLKEFNVHDEISEGIRELPNDTS